MAGPWEKDVVCSRLRVQLPSLLGSWLDSCVCVRLVGFVKWLQLPMATKKATGSSHKKAIAPGSGVATRESWHVATDDHQMFTVCVL